jgi:hypothetical protein
MVVLACSISQQMTAHPCTVRNPRPILDAADCERAEHSLLLR